MAEDQLGIKHPRPDLFRRPSGRPEGRQGDQDPGRLAGVKLRMPGGDAWQFLGTALGANPTPMAYAEVYTGLQTGAIDGQDNPLPNVENMKFYEVMNQIVLTSHLVGFDLLTISKTAWDAPWRRAAGKGAGRRRRRHRLLHREHLAREKELAETFKGRGLEDL
jgi:TRAP-type C4-dicarboxylate transport system substrate-binding protein